MTNPTPVLNYGEILDAICADIKATQIFEPKAKIEPAPGPLTESWIKKNAMPHGGALPAIARVAGIEVYANSVLRHTLNLGIYFFPKPESRNRQAKDIANDVSEIISRIHQNRWNLAGAKKPENIRAANRYSAALDNKGATLWTIDWQQSFLLSGQTDNAVRLGLVTQGEQNIAS